MGGGQQWLDEKKLYDVLEELQIVAYHVENFSGPEPYSFYLGDKIFKIVSKDIKKFLTSNGIKHKETILDGMGGGGGITTLVECIQLFIENLSQYGAIISAIKFIDNVISIFWIWYKYSYINKASKSRPNLVIKLEIGSHSQFDDKYLGAFQTEIGSYASNLLVLSEGIVNNMHGLHPLIDCDINLLINIGHIQHKIEVRISHKHHQQYTFRRLEQILRNNIICKNVSKVYLSTSWLAIHRSDTLEILPNKIRVKDYYLVFSNKVIADYFGIKSKNVLIG